MQLKSAYGKIDQKDMYAVTMAAFGYFLIGFYCLLCIIPFVIIIASSMTEEKTVLVHGYNLWPRNFSFDTYRLVFQYPKVILGAFGVTISLTVIGTIIGLFLTTMTGYALQRVDFPFRNKFSFYIYFTTLFSGGLVPFYLLIVKYLHLKDNYLSVLLPLLMSPWLIILMKNFLKSIPHSITESAKIDGAGDFTIFIRLIFPLAKPALATVGLFLAIGYWNEWYNAMLFLSASVKFRPIQLYLYTVINTAYYINNSSAGANVAMHDYPTETTKLAVAVLATVPGLFFYPFVHRYFIKGITIGSVKG